MYCIMVGGSSSSCCCCSPVFSSAHPSFFTERNFTHNDSYMRSSFSSPFFSRNLSHGNVHVIFILFDTKKLHEENAGRKIAVIKSDIPLRYCYCDDEGGKQEARVTLPVDC
jgi:hypothetical protein